MELIRLGKKEIEKVNTVVFYEQERQRERARVISVSPRASPERCWSEENRLYLGYVYIPCGIKRFTQIIILQRASYVRLQNEIVEAICRARSE